MRFIPTKVHGALDYLVGALLIISPWIFGFSDGGGANMWVPIVLGAGVILYSILTNYELGLMRVIPMPVHLMLDLAGGVVLAASPWLFGFSDEVMYPHLIIGLLEIGAAALSQSQPEEAERSDTGHPSSTRLAS